MGNSSLHCHLDTGAYVSIINTAQLKQTKKTLVSYSQHQITPKGYITLPVRFKNKELNELKEGTSMS